MGNNMSVKEAAEILGKSQQWVKHGIINGKLEFGTALKLSSVYSFYISPKRLYEFAGIEPPKDLKDDDEIQSA